MANTDIFIKGVGSVAIVGIVVFIITKLQSYGVDKYLMDFFKKKQQEKQDEIEIINKKKEKIINEIIVSDKDTEETKVKIETKIEVKKKEVEEILKETDLGKIDQQIQEDMGKL